MASGWKSYDRSKARDRSPYGEKRSHKKDQRYKSPPPRRVHGRSISPVKDSSREFKHPESSGRERDRRLEADERNRGRARDRNGDRNDERRPNRDLDRTAERRSDMDQRLDVNHDRKQKWGRSAESERERERDRERDHDRVDGWGAYSRTYERGHEQVADVDSQQYLEYYDLDQEEHERDRADTDRLDYSERDNRRGKGRQKATKTYKPLPSTSRNQYARSNIGNYRPAHSNDSRFNNRGSKYDHNQSFTHDKRAPNDRNTGKHRSRSPPLRQAEFSQLDLPRDEGGSRKKRKLESFDRNRYESRTRRTHNARQASHSRSPTRSRSRTRTPSSLAPQSRSPSPSSLRQRSPLPLPPQPPRPPRRTRRSPSISKHVRDKSPASDHSRWSSTHSALSPRKPRQAKSPVPRSPFSQSSIDGRPFKVPSRLTRPKLSRSRSSDSRRWDDIDGRADNTQLHSPSRYHSRGRPGSSHNSSGTPPSRRIRSSSTSRPRQRGTTHSSTSRERVSSPISPSHLRHSRRGSFENELGPPPQPPQPPVGPRFAPRDPTFRRGQPNHNTSLVPGPSRQSKSFDRDIPVHRQDPIKSRRWDDNMDHVPKGPRARQGVATINGTHPAPEITRSSAPSKSVIRDSPPTPPPPPRPITPQPPPPPPPPPLSISKRLPSPRRIKPGVNHLHRPPGMPPIAPVAQTSAGVRRFFPGDDDDDSDLNGAAIETTGKLSGTLWHPTEEEPEPEPEPDKPAEESPLPLSPPPKPPKPPTPPLSSFRAVPTSPIQSNLHTSRRPSRTPSPSSPRRTSPSHHPQDPRSKVLGRPEYPHRQSSSYRQKGREYSTSGDGRWPRWPRGSHDHKAHHDEDIQSYRYTNGINSSILPPPPTSSDWDAPLPPPLPDASINNPTHDHNGHVSATLEDSSRDPHPLTSPSMHGAPGSQGFGSSFASQPPPPKEPIFNQYPPPNAFPTSHPTGPHTQTGIPPWPSSLVPTQSRPLTKDVYERIVQVGEGTYGKVYKARNVETGGLVAMKRIRMEAEKDGFPITAIREIKLLQGLQHPNIVNLVEMVVSKGHVYIVFEYMDHDLSGVLHHPNIHFSEANIKSLMWQLLAGLRYMHEGGVLHRDLKGSNILLNRVGELKIADFGLARRYERGKEPGREGRGRGRDYTNRVITLWYKPPELLFGATVYGEEVDMWSAGAIFLELFTRRPIFQANDEIDQLHATFKLIGTPNRSTWADVIYLPWYELVKPKTECKSKLRETFFNADGSSNGEKMVKSEGGMVLAENLLEMNPARRPSAKKAMEFQYFLEEEPAMELPTKVLSSVKGEWHELESKRARKQRREG